MPSFSKTIDISGTLPSFCNYTKRPPDTVNKGDIRGLVFTSLIFPVLGIYKALSKYIVPLSAGRAGARSEVLVLQADYRSAAALAFCRLGLVPSVFAVIRAGYVQLLRQNSIIKLLSFVFDQKANGFDLQGQSYQ